MTAKPARAPTSAVTALAAILWRTRDAPVSSLYHHCLPRPRGRRYPLSAVAAGPGGTVSEPRGVSLTTDAAGTTGTSDTTKAPVAAIAAVSAAARSHVCSMRTIATGTAHATGTAGPAEATVAAFGTAVATGPADTTGRASPAPIAVRGQCGTAVPDGALPAGSTITAVSASAVESAVATGPAGTTFDADSTTAAVSAVTAVTTGGYTGPGFAVSARCGTGAGLATGPGVTGVTPMSAVTTTLTGARYRVGAVTAVPADSGGPTVPRQHHQRPAFHRSNPRLGPDRPVHRHRQLRRPHHFRPYRRTRHRYRPR